MLKEIILIESFYVKELCLLLKPYLEPLACSPESYLLLFWLSLVEYFYTQGSLTLVAGESHEQVCFGPCCMTVFKSKTISKCVALGQGTLIGCFVLCY